MFALGRPLKTFSDGRSAADEDAFELDYTQIAERVHHWVESPEATIRGAIACGSTRIAAVGYAMTMADHLIEQSCGILARLSDSTDPDDREAVRVARLRSQAGNAARAAFERASGASSQGTAHQRVA